VVLCACDGDDAGADALTCAEGDREIGEELQRRWSGTACTAHDECTARAPSVECPGDRARYTWCALAVHFDDSARLQATLDGVLEDLCPRIPRDCIGGASCAARVPRCVGGRCAQVDPIEQCVAECNACDVLSTCEGHCPAHHECILAAESCEATVECVSGPRADAG